MGTKIGENGRNGISRPAARRGRKTVGGSAGCGLEVFVVPRSDRLWCRDCGGIGGECSGGTKYKLQIYDLRFQIAAPRAVG